LDRAPGPLNAAALLAGLRDGGKFYSVEAFAARHAVNAGLLPPRVEAFLRAAFDVSGDASARYTLEGQTLLLTLCDGTMLHRCATAHAALGGEEATEGAFVGAVPSFLSVRVAASGGLCARC
jgi:hypothetical protein